MREGTRGVCRATAGIAQALLLLRPPATPCSHNVSPSLSQPGACSGPSASGTCPHSPRSLLTPSCNPLDLCPSLGKLLSTQPCSLCPADREVPFLLGCPWCAPCCTGPHHLPPTCFLAVHSSRLLYQSREAQSNKQAPGTPGFPRHGLHTHSTVTVGTPGAQAEEQPPPHGHLPQA